jgi:hypothetical protein
MREPLWIFQRRFVDRKLPLPIVKAYIYLLLVGLDYLHSECKIVHPGKCLSLIIRAYSGSQRLNQISDLKLGKISS